MVHRRRWATAFVFAVFVFIPTSIQLVRTTDQFLRLGQLQEQLLLNALTSGDIVLCQKDSENKLSVVGTAQNVPDAANTSLAEVLPRVRSDRQDIDGERAMPARETLSQQIIEEKATTVVAPTQCGRTEPPPRVVDVPKPLGIPIPSSLSPTSACLLFSDDNHRLPEWIAYHYYAMGLRNLIVAVDPHSTTRPTEILDRWRPYLNIAEEWEHRNANNTVHRTRQPTFYKTCSEYLQTQGASWTSYHDNDEFIVFNRDRIPDAEGRMREPNSLLSALANVSKTDPHHQIICNQIPRLLLTCVESKPEEITRDVPAPFDPLQFDTLRYRFKTFRRNKSNGNPKSLLDLSRANLKGNTYHTHRVHSTLCHASVPPPKSNLFVIYHYLGPWAAYARPRDERKGALRNYQIWQYRSSIRSGGTTDVVRLWLQGFVDRVGLEAAQHLLRGAGLPPDAPEQDRDAWSLSVEEMKEHARGRGPDRAWTRWVQQWLADRNVTTTTGSS